MDFHTLESSEGLGEQVTNCVLIDVIYILASDIRTQIHKDEGTSWGHCSGTTILFYSSFDEETCPYNNIWTSLLI